MHQLLKHQSLHRVQETIHFQPVAQFLARRVQESSSVPDFNI